jgi:hypothetical protein
MPLDPPDPSATVTDDSDPAVPTTSVTSPVLTTDATFVDLPAALLAESSGSINPVKERLDAAELAARSTVTGADDPEPLAPWWAWLASPQSRKFRIAAGLGCGAFAALLLLFLFTSPPLPAPLPPMKRIPAVPAEPPRVDRLALDAPKIFTAEPPMFVDVEVDGGIEKREGGMVRLNSTPETEVVVNGKRLGTTPVYVSAPLGRVDVILESRDAGIYKPVSVTIYGGRNPPQSWELARGWLEVIAPPGSSISVDGRALGAAPIAQLALFEGLHRIDVVRPDKSRVTSRVEVVANFTITHEIPER